MIFDVFLMILLIVSTLTGLTTEAIKMCQHSCRVCGSDVVYSGGNSVHHSIWCYDKCTGSSAFGITCLFVMVGRNGWL